MAIAIPYIVSYATGSATVGALVGIAFAVSGENKKINEASDKAFGKDFTNAVNIAGTLYGAYNMASGMMSDSGPEPLSDGAYPDSVAPEVDPSSAVDSSAAVAAAEVPAAPLPGAEATATGPAAPTTEVPQPGQAAAPTTPAPSTDNVVSRSIAQQPTPKLEVPKMETPNVRINQPQVQGPSLNLANAPAAAQAPTGSNFFDMLKSGATSAIKSPLAPYVLMGGANAYSAAQQREAERARYDEQMRMANYGLGGYYRKKG